MEVHNRNHLAATYPFTANASGSTSKFDGKSRFLQNQDVSPSSCCITYFLLKIKDLFSALFSWLCPRSETKVESTRATTRPITQEDLRELLSQLEQEGFVSLVKTTCTHLEKLSSISKQFNQLNQEKHDGIPVTEEERLVTNPVIDPQLKVVAEEIERVKMFIPAYYADNFWTLNLDEELKICRKYERLLILAQKISAASYTSATLENELNDPHFDAPQKKLFNAAINKCEDPAKNNLEKVILGFYDTFVEERFRKFHNDLSPSLNPIKELNS